MKHNEIYLAVMKQILEQRPDLSFDDVKKISQSISLDIRDGGTKIIASVLLPPNDQDVTIEVHVEPTDD